MSRPPIKAIESIRRYCEKTQCRKCVYGIREEIGYDDYVGCELQQNNPCDWRIDEDELQRNGGGTMK